MSVFQWEVATREMFSHCWAWLQRTHAVLMDFFWLPHLAGSSLAPCHVLREFNQWADELTRPDYGGFSAEPEPYLELCPISCCFPPDVGDPHRFLRYRLKSRDRTGWDVLFSFLFQVHTTVRRREIEVPDQF